MAHLETDEEARRAAEAAQPREIWGFPVPEGEWVGPDAVEEFDDGKGDGDDGERPCD